MFDAFVLAAGFGTRLRPLTEHRPKPLVPVCGVPLLSYALAHCARHGLREVVVNAHHLAHQLEPWAGEREGVNVAISVEPDILGTGGGLKHVAGRLAERFVVVNGDVLTDVDLSALRAAVPAGGAAMALRAVPGAGGYGVVAADAGGTVVHLTSLAKAGEPVRTDTHFTGIHAMDRAALDRVPEGFACVVRTAYTALVPERKVVGVLHEGLWLDLGTPSAYFDACFAVLDRKVRPPLDPFPRAAWARSGGYAMGDREAIATARVEDDAWIGTGAEVSGARIRHSIVGEGARLARGVDLVDCVVWDGVTVGPGRYERAIFYDGGVRYVR